MQQTKRGNNMYVYVGRTPYNVDEVQLEKDLNRDMIFFVSLNTQGILTVDNMNNPEEYRRERYKIQLPKDEWFTCLIPRWAGYNWTYEGSVYRDV